jgi:uncharacterized protein (TIGR03435 family)
MSALVVFSVHHAHCQPPVNAPAFEVASITPCKPGTPEPPGEHMGMFQFTYPGGRLDAKATTVKFLFEWAYGILPAQHSSGPVWFSTDRYDFVAKAAGNATDAEIKLMTRTMLADRFHLKMHHEEKELPVLIVTVGKSAPKLYPPKDGEVRSLHVAPQSGADQKNPSFHISATRYSLTQLLDVFARQLTLVILNRTGLDGDFDFAFDLTPDESNPNPLEATHVISAMQSELGLTLKSQKAPVDFYVIDSAEKVTAGNE